MSAIKDAAKSTAGNGSNRRPISTTHSRIFLFIYVTQLYLDIEIASRKKEKYKKQAMGRGKKKAEILEIESAKSKWTEPGGARSSQTAYSSTPCVGICAEERGMVDGRYEASIDVKTTNSPLSLPFSLPSTPDSHTKMNMNRNQSLLPNSYSSHNKHRALHRCRGGCDSQLKSFDMSKVR